MAETMVAIFDGKQHSEWFSPIRVNRSSCICEALKHHLEGIDRDAKDISFIEIRISEVI